MPKEAIKSMFKEVKQMVDKKVWKGVNLASTSYKHQKKVIKSFMFLKEKFKSNGLFEKLKARLVGSGAYPRGLTILAHRFSSIRLYGGRYRC